MNFSSRELLDLGVAWIALGVAFTFFFARVRPAELIGFIVSPVFLQALFVSLLTVGIGFLLHELAHKVVAVHYGQYARFKADFGMLALAVAGGLAGFIFAAPGAVVHRGRLTERQHGLIALAGPVTNLGLAALFAPLMVFLPLIGSRGVEINLLLAAFNMLPIGGLDGNTVRSWSTAVYVVVLVPSALLAIGVLIL